MKSNSWPALASSIPESNNALVYSEVDNARNGPAKNNSNDSGNGNSRNNGNSNSNDGSNGNPNNPIRLPIMLSPKIWKYLKPADLDQCIEVNGSTYYWCAKCTCRNTSKAGLYNLTHSTSQHCCPSSSSFACPADNETSANGTDSANISSVPTVPSGTSLSSNNQQKLVKFANPVVKGDDDDDNDDDDEEIDPDPDRFQFHGAFMHADKKELRSVMLTTMIIMTI